MDTNLFHRRRFLQNSAVVSAALAMSTLPRPSWANAAGSDTIRLGLIGCGGRGRGAVGNAVVSSPGVELHAVADVFADQVQGALNDLRNQKDERIRNAIKVTPDREFVGFDAYQRLLAIDVDYVLLALPPYFHSRILEAAIDAGKHVFVEKPIAIDGPSLRQVRRAGEKATKRGLGILHGTQRRHASSTYGDIIRRIHDGAIGDLIYGEAHWNNADWKLVPREPNWSDTEWHIRNWRKLRWLGGDLPGVLVIHYLDVMNWAFQDVPAEAFGVGGRQHWASDGPHGNIYDHFQSTLTYADGRRVSAMTRIMPGDAMHSELILGTRGRSHPGKWIKGESNYRPSGPAVNAYVNEHRVMIESMRAGEPINEAMQGVEAALSAIMVRESAYTGKVVKAEFMLEESQRLLGPDIAPYAMEFGDYPIEPAAVPGEYQLM